MTPAFALTDLARDTARLTAAGAQLRGTTAPTPWGGSRYTWTDYAHLPR